jgi:membrane protein
MPRLLPERDKLNSTLRKLIAELRRFYDLVRHCARRFRADQLGHIAGSLAFTTVLATVPLAAVVFGAFSLLPGFQEWLEPVRVFLLTHLLPASGDIVGKRIEEFSHNVGGLTATGAALLIVSALALMATIERTFNFLWRATRARPLIQRLVTYWAVLTLGPALIGAGIGMSKWITTHAAMGTAASHLISALLPVALEFAAVTLLFLTVPNVRVRWRDAMAGALFSTVLFEILKRAFVVFVSSAVSYQVIYGAIAAVPVFMMWIYLSWMACLLGAILSATLHERGTTAR